MEAVDIGTALQSLPLTVLLLLVLIGGYREWWFYGPIHRERLTRLQTEADEWKRRYLKRLGNGDPDHANK